MNKTNIEARANKARANKASVTRALKALKLEIAADEQELLAAFHNGQPQVVAGYRRRIKRKTRLLENLQAGKVPSTPPTV